MSDGEPFTDKHRAALIRQRAQEAVQRGLGVGGQSLTAEEKRMAAGLARGATVCMEAKESRILDEKLGIDNLPRTVEDIEKAAERSAYYDNGNSGGN
jgi:hypothetical protein